MELLIRTFYIYDTDGWGKFNVDVLFLVLGNLAFVGTNIIRYRGTIIRHHFPVKMLLSENGEVLVWAIVPLSLVVLSILLKPGVAFPCCLPKVL